MQRSVIGIDVGGTSIKGAAIDLSSGQTTTSRHRVSTPAGGMPADIAREVGGMVAAIREECVVPAAAPVGIAVPGVVRDGIVRTAANIDASWVSVDARALFSKATGSPCAVVNDADAAGVAETVFNSEPGFPGTTVVVTFGTGIGSAVIYDGVLIPNFELGHLQLDGHSDIEQHASARAIEREGITLDEWADRAARYLSHVELLLNPDRFIIGGSISKDAQKYLPFRGVSAPVTPARFRNNAGIVGAAWLANRAAH